MNPKIKNKVVIDDKFFSKTVGIILSGTVLKGEINVGDFMMLGPDKGGHFHEVKIVGMHKERVDA